MNHPTLPQIAAAVDFHSVMISFSKHAGNARFYAKHKRELLKLEALIICMMNARPSNVVNISDYRRAS